MHLTPAFRQQLALVEAPVSQFFSVEGNGNNGPSAEMQVVWRPLLRHRLSKVDAERGAHAVFELVDEPRLEPCGTVS